MYEEIRQQLISLSDSKFKDFSQRLTPGCSEMLGVRTPDLKKLAKGIAAADWRAYLKNAPEVYHEDFMLIALTIAYAKMDIGEKLHYIDDFVPKIHDWAVCDSLCSAWKPAKAELPTVWAYIDRLKDSTHEYVLRFYCVMMLSKFIDDAHIDDVLARLDAVKHNGYYVKMAVAWALSVCYVKFPGKTHSYLQSDGLDDFTHNKTIQKIVESFRVSPEQKAILKRMKRGGNK